jgi:hypothetical protein
MTGESDQDNSKRDYMVFISHAGSDTWVAKKLAKSIEESGATTFLDEAHIAIGEDFEDRILDALDKVKGINSLFYSLVAYASICLDGDWCCMGQAHADHRHSSWSDT